jgi:membrane-bound metal-dependent hydrolase YbcI (DUF457 family)
VKEVPGWKGHVLGGIATPVAVTFYTGFGAGDPMLVAGIVTSVAGSLIPDLDADYSKIRQLIPRVAKLYDKLPKDNLVFKHRGLFLHSVYTLIPFIVLYLKWNSWVTLGLFLGVLSHHILDGISPKGLPNYLGGKTE